MNDLTPILDSSNLSDLTPFFKDGELNIIKDLQIYLEPQAGNSCKVVAAYHMDLIIKRLMHPTLSPLNVKIQYTQSIQDLPSDSLGHKNSSYMSIIQKMGSSVGEIYGSVGIIQLLAKNNVAAEVYQPKSELDYIDSLRSQIKKGGPALVFFDAGSDNGRPVLHQSKHEHGAVVVGHGSVIDEDNFLSEDYFITAHQQKFHIVKGIDLAKSARQLVERTPETFHLVSVDNEKKWLTADDIKRYRKSYQDGINKLEKIYTDLLSTLKQSYETVTVLEQFLGSIPLLNHISYTPESMKIYRLKLNNNEFQVTQKQVEAELTKFQNIIQYYKKQTPSIQAYLKNLQNWVSELPRAFDDYDLDSKRTRKSTYQVGARSLANSIIFAKVPLNQPNTDKEQQVATLSPTMLAG